ncbi:VOC family protein [Candidatus Binatia bacterium]|nr:VOC family protein [Candidatus Binatia bacterium]
MLRLRQVALAARDLESVVDDLCAVLGIEVAYRDPGVGVFGLRNAVMPVGDTFIEVVSPVQEGTTAGRFLDRRGGDGGYMAIFQCDDLDVARVRVAAAGVRIVWSIDLPEARTIHLHPRDVGGAIVSLDTMVPPASWQWAGPHWRERVRSEVAIGIVGAEIEADDIEATAARWAAVLGVGVTVEGESRRVTLDGGEVRFVPAAAGRGDGMVTVDLAVADLARLLGTARRRGLAVTGNRVRIGGVSFRAVAAEAVRP